VTVDGILFCKGSEGGNGVVWLGAAVIGVSGLSMTTGRLGVMASRTVLKKGWLSSSKFRKLAQAVVNTSSVLNDSHFENKWK
jgi:hypothetical protein